MALIVSISGIRGTIGGTPGEGLTPIDIMNFTSAYAEWIRNENSKKKYKVIIGRDARPSGIMVERIVTGTLTGMGIDVVNLGLAATPTVEIAVVKEKADGGIIITASHNPGHWNALKLLNCRGEFISSEDGEKILEMTINPRYTYAEHHRIGNITSNNTYNNFHIQEILNLDLVKPELIRQAEFKIAVDAVNSVGGVIIPKLLTSLGVKEIVQINCRPDGIFKHDPEPLPENLMEISRIVKEKKADAGFVVDPDVDRLAIISEDGTMFGEEYTLVAVADYVLSNTPGNTVSNLSSTKALKDITISYGKEYFASEVGEVNVVKAMKVNNSVIGGEGNGGVIYPASHYGRDALVGIGLFLTLLAEKKIRCSELKKIYPQYVISKQKLSLSKDISIEKLLEKIKQKYSSEKIDIRDGVRIDFKDKWVQLRKSNTEPVLRIYAEACETSVADALIQEIIKIMKG